MLEAIVDLIGEVPAGYEPLAWVVCAAVVFMFLSSLLHFLSSLFGRR